MQPSSQPPHASTARSETWRRWAPTCVFATAILLVYPLDVLIVRGHNLPTLLTRAVWALEVLGYNGVWWRTTDARRQRVLMASHGAIMSALFVVIIDLTGGADSPYMHFALTLPLLLGLIMPQDVGPALFSGITTTVGLLVMVLLQHGDVPLALTWALMMVTATFFGVYGSSQFRKTQAAENEVQLERTRREAMEKLAVAERHRAQAEKMATVGRLAANVMHEINNPLAFVRSNLDFLRTEVLAQPLPEETRQELREVFEETRSGVERISDIVKDLKGFSRMDAEEPSECALADVVADAGRLAGVRLKNVARLAVELPEGLPGVFVTRPRLTQVILNLLVNAGDALEEARVRDGVVWVRGRVEGDHVALFVEDNGPGIPSHVLPRLFEPFFTTKKPEKGTGLGLSISRELVERFGGRLSAENRPEGGARLRLELPVHVPPTPLPSGEGQGEGA